MEGTEVLVGDPEHFIGLICLDEGLSELFHQGRCDRPRERNYEVVVQVTNTILSYLFEIGRCRFDKVDDGKVRDTLTGRTNVLVQ